MARLTGSHRRQGLGGSLLVIATLLLMLGLFVVAVLATTRVEAASNHSRDYYEGEDRRQGEAFHWDGQLSRGQTLAVHGINGSIEVEGTSGGDVVVDAEKRSRKSGPEDVKIVVDRTNDGVSVCALYRRKDGS